MTAGHIIAFGALYSWGRRVFDDNVLHFVSSALRQLLVGPREFWGCDAVLCARDEHLSDSQRYHFGGRTLSIVIGDLLGCASD